MNPNHDSSSGQQRSKALAALVVLASVTGFACASAPPAPVEVTPSYHEQISRWSGETEANLVTAWGVPGRTHVLATGGRIIEYVQVGAGESLCTTRFTLDESGTIMRWWYTGNDCHAPRSG